MEKTYHIGEIAHLFGIPASTLRYWEQMGVLVSRKDPVNQYRMYTVADLMTISDILFYKNLGLSLKQIQAMEQTTSVEHKNLLEHKITDLQYQKQEMERRIHKLQFHLAAIEQLHQLEEIPFSEGDIDSECIVPFEFIEIDKLKQYIGNPYRYSRVQHTECLQEEWRGLTIAGDQVKVMSNQKILWKKGNSRYVICLLKEEITDHFPNNLPELLAHVHKKYKTGYIISRFLLCAKECGKLYDFYKTYIEII